MWIQLPTCSSSSAPPPKYKESIQTSSLVDFIFSINKIFSKFYLCLSGLKEFGFFPSQTGRRKEKPRPSSLCHPQTPRSSAHLPPKHLLVLLYIMSRNVGCNEQREWDAFFCKNLFLNVLPLSSWLVCVGVSTEALLPAVFTLVCSAETTLSTSSERWVSLLSSNKNGRDWEKHQHWKFLKCWFEILSSLGIQTKIQCGWEEGGKGWRERGEERKKHGHWVGKVFWHIFSKLCTLAQICANLFLSLT